MALSFAAGGCTAARPAPFAARFIVPGTPAVDLTAPVGARETAAARLAAAGPDAPPVPDRSMSRPAAVAPASTLEATSPLLRARLAALAASPTAAAHLDVAAAYQAYGIHDRAFDYLEAGLTRWPKDSSLHDAVARLWRDWGFPDRAVRHAHLAVRHAPSSAAAATTLGSVLWALAAYDEALVEFTRARRLEPDADWARGNWCIAVLALGRPRPFSCDTPYPTPARPGPLTP